ncbi:tyrosine-protein phosphatase [Mucilaginibacter psychrotolerans]|uniref:Tyrosine-protein phosphatase n=1 Tax=Mucilaginibacter psychrotolerans TaxID=1524096 RepID=A0A4Y8SHP5_9SPHI|nr:tyrosine-protein phosphatase [Mucilaginibacter psychrotolerans]TFF38165.1 tyrosine-protein phosphatase [Mucilaginibacter psychrotolerans]
MKKIFFALTLLVAFAAGSKAQVADSARRMVALHGAANFRDLGGYKTTSGKTVKWGKVYRSADISRLTDADLAVLRDKKISYDVDLRGHQEAQQQPDKLNPGTDYVLCPAGSDSLSFWMKQIMTAPKNSGDSIMTAYYSNTRYLAERYRPFFDKLLAVPADQSLVFHCTAGKDRTGIAAALFLYSLGVPYETIMADYTATNYYRTADNDRSIKGMVGMMHMDEGTARSMMSAKKEYLDATFAAINKQYGSVDNFIKEQLKLNNKQLTALKSKYLE